jgi:hypothetical protein
MLSKEGIIEKLDKQIEIQKNEVKYQEMEKDPNSYRNVLVQDKEVLKIFSGELAKMYKDSVQKMPKLLTDLEYYKPKEFNFEKINDNYLKNDHCGVRDLISKRIFSNETFG